MIVDCEKCDSKFNLDDALIQETGSKVRCSVCKHIFIVFPFQKIVELDSLVEETAPLDSPPASGREASEMDDIFDKAFEEALQEDIDEDSEKLDDTEPLIEGKTRTVKKEKKGRGWLLIFLIIAFILISGYISVYLFAPGLLPSSLSGVYPDDDLETADTGNRRLDIDDLSSNFIPTDRMGQVYVIKGKIINNYPASRSYILIKGSIEDENKKTVDQKLVYAGNIFTENELKGMTREEIEKGMSNKTGKNNSNLNVLSQFSVPFMIVFYDLPDNISEFLVETISSSPGN